MAKPKENKKRVGRIVIGPVRLSYCKLASPDPDDDFFKVKVLTPSKDKTMQAQVSAAIKAAAAKKFGEKESKKLLKSSKFGMPLRFPKEEGLSSEEYKGNYFFNCKSSGQPNMLLKNGTKLLTKEDITEELYSGVWVHISVGFYGFDGDSSKGVAVWLNNIIKYKDDKRLDGGVAAEEELSEYIDIDADVGKKKKGKKDKAKDKKKDKKQKSDKDDMEDKKDKKKKKGKGGKKKKAENDEL